MTAFHGRMIPFYKFDNSQIYQMNESAGVETLRDFPRDYKRDRKIKIDINKTEYPLFRSIALNDMGWKIWGKEDPKGEVNVFWNDTYISEENVKRLKPYQRINHFPNSQELGKKNLLSQNLKKMKLIMPDEYDFFPETFNLPEEELELQSAMKNKKWWIVKPASSSQGKGIFLTRDINSIPKENSIVQQYITHPHLIDKCKYDLRIYVFIKSLFPLKIFRYEEGLTRLSTSAYEQPSKSNKKNLNMHLTNYAINRLSPNYIPNRDAKQDFEGHKRSLASAFQSLQECGCDKGQMQKQIDEIIVKTILSGYPKMLESYKNCRDCDMEGESVCFEILGFDIIIDETLKPWLLEVNHSPSFYTDTPLDLMIKKHLIIDTFLLLNLKALDKEQFLKKCVLESNTKDVTKQKWNAKIKRNADSIFENIHQGAYTKAYPSQNPLYSEILKKIYEKKAAMNNKSLLKSYEDTKDTKEEEKKRIVKKKSLDGSLLKSKVKNPYFTFYGHYEVMRGKRIQSKEEETNEDEAIRRHISMERERKKVNEPMKINNISISFYDDMKTQFQNGYQTRIVSNNAHKPNIISVKGNQSQPKSCESKTADGSRKEIKLIDYEIRSRIGKMKLARIKLQKIKNMDKQSEPHSSRIMRDSMLKDQIRGSSKII